jgi:transcriptional repressor NrdR
VETTQIRVIKRNGQRVPYDRQKLQQGLERACWKRSISDTQISTLIARVESDIDSMFETEVESQFIGERVMQYLRELDQVAFVRFASVYRHFQDANDFTQELTEMLEDPDDVLFTLKSFRNPPKLRFPKANKGKKT